MGYSLSWIATRGISSDQVQRHLGLRATSDGEPIPKSSCTAAELGSGWHIVFLSDGCDSVDRRAKTLLAQCPEAITCYVEEHVMASGVSAWNNGQKIWSVEHQADEGIFNLDIQGSAPEILEEIVHFHRSQQTAEGGESADVDYIFEIPIVLAEKLVGFRHDADYDYSGHDPWFVCEMSPLGDTATPKKAGCLPIVLLVGTGVAGFIVTRFG